MNNNYKKKLLQLSKLYEELMNMNLSLMNKVYMSADNPAMKELVQVFKQYRTLPEYKKELSSILATVK